MLATMVEHVIGIDPDRDRVTAAVVDTATTGEQATAVFGTTRLGYDRFVEMGRPAHSDGLTGCGLWKAPAVTEQA